MANRLKPTDFLSIDVDKVIPKLLSKPDSRVILEDVIGDMVYDIPVREAELLEGLPYNIKNLKKIDPIVIGEMLVKYVTTVVGDWTDRSDQTTANQMYQSLPLFVEMSEHLPYVNPSEKYKAAFRGTDLRDEKVHAFIKKTKPKDWKLVRLGGESWMSYVGPLKTGFVYTPHRAVQSWSVSDKAARGFGSSVLTTNIDNSFFFDPNFTGQFGYKHEKETVHFGKEPIKVALLINKGDYDDLASRKRVYETDGIKEANEVEDEEGTLIIPGI